MQLLSETVIAPLPNGRVDFTRRGRMASVAVMIALLVALMPLANVAPVAAQDPPASESEWPPLLDTAGLDKNTPKTLEEARRLEEVVRTLSAKVRAAAVGLRVGRAGGSGTIISPDGWIATAAHVTENPNREVTVFLSDGTRFQGRSMGLNRPRDYALVKFDPGDRKIPWVNMGDSDKVAVGQWVVSMGHPLGTETDPFRPPVVRLGRVARNQPRQIVGDGPLISGDSGGPMFTLNGELIGINVSIQIANAKINNATPINLLKQNLDRCKSGEKFGGDGASSADLQGAIQSAYGLLDDASQSNDQAKFGEAEKAFKAAIAMDESGGDTWYHLACCYTRWSGSLEGAAQAAKIDAAFDALNKAVDKGWENLEHMTTDRDMDAIRDMDRFHDVVVRIRRNSGQSAYLGISGDDTADGFRVTSVGERGPADRAGIKPGDLIQKFGETTVRTAAELQAAVQAARPGDEVVVSGTREGLAMTFTVTLSGREVTGRTVTNKDDGEFRKVFESICAAAARGTARIAVNRRAAGFAIVVRADGLLLAKNSDLQRAQNMTVILADGQNLPATRTAYDDQLDLALVRVDAENLKLDVAPLAATSACPIGSWLFSVSNDAVPFAVGVRSLDDYQTLRASDRPYFGVIEPRELTGFAAQTMGVDAGLLVTKVELRSGADRAGLREGDVIYRIDNKPIGRLRDLVAVLQDHRVGDTVRVEVMRNQESKSIRVTLTKRPGTDDEGGLGGLFNRGGMNQIKGPTSKRDSGFGAVIQHDGIVLPDKVGGPVVNIEGKVVAMNIGRSDRTKTYALPVEVLRTATEQLIERAAMGE
ncbi:MAG: S1C family serine protease [Planctomycetota bacterium]